MNLKKNILDLNYQKYLQHYVVSLIILFTYLIGVVIAFLTKQINIGDFNQIVYLIVISIFVIISLSVCLVAFNKRLRDIIGEIEILK